VITRIPPQVSAKTEEEDIVQGLRCGADDYVPKPFKRAELAARIRAHIRARDAFQQQQVGWDWRVGWGHAAWSTNNVVGNPVPEQDQLGHSTGRYASCVLSEVPREVAAVTGNKHVHSHDDSLCHFMLRSEVISVVERVLS
jgi:hypothetical protein